MRWRRPRSQCTKFSVCRAIAFAKASMSFLRMMPSPLFTRRRPEPRCARGLFYENSRLRQVVVGTTPKRAATMSSSSCVACSRGFDRRAHLATRPATASPATRPGLGRSRRARRPWPRGRSSSGHHRRRRPRRRVHDEVLPFQSDGLAVDDDCHSTGLSHLRQASRSLCLFCHCKGVIRQSCEFHGSVPTGRESPPATRPISRRHQAIANPNKDFVFVETMFLSPSTTTKPEQPNCSGICGMSGPSTTQFVAVCNRVARIPCHIFTLHTHTWARRHKPPRDCAARPLHLLRAGAASSSATVVEVDDLCVLCVSASDVGERSRRKRDGRRAPRLFWSDAARTYQGSARREALERRLRTEGAAGQRLDHEIRERLAHELRHRDSKSASRRRVRGVKVRLPRRTHVAHCVISAVHGRQRF